MSQFIYQYQGCSHGTGGNPTNDNPVTNPNPGGGVIRTIPLEGPLPNWQPILDCINSPTLIGQPNTDSTTIDSEILEQLNLSRTQIDNFNNFLQDNGCIDAAQEDVIEDLLEIFDELIFLDDEFSDNICLKSVYDGMGKASNFKSYLENFDPQASVAHLRFSTSSSLPSNVNAETSPPDNYLITITFNSNNLDRPSLFVATTFIHEMIHAEIFRKLLSAANQPNLNYSGFSDEAWRNFITNLSNNFEGLYDYYLRWQWNVPAGQNPSSAQHEAMAQHYRDIIIQAIEDFDADQTDEVYEALSWGGLMGSGTFNASTGLYSNSTVAWSNKTQEERLNIISTINTFNSSNTNCQE